MMNNCAFVVKVSPDMKTFTGQCFFFCTESSAVKYCTAVRQCNLIRSRRDLEVGQNHIYQ